MTKKILICDDEEGVRESMRLVLGDTYDLIVTETPEECLNTFQNTPDIGLVFLDIKMPKMSGLDVLKEMKSLREDMKIIIVTGYKSVETAAEASKLGADGYIIKPFESEDILRVVQQHLGS